jgi:hypothetical protein
LFRLLAVAQRELARGEPPERLETALLVTGSDRERQRDRASSEVRNPSVKVFPERTTTLRMQQLEPDPERLSRASLEERQW